MSDAASVNSARDRRWLILGVIGLAQLMVVLDLTVMNIALPSAQRALGFTTADRQWVVTAYTLAFGSLGAHTGYAAGVLGPIVLAGVGMGMIIAPAISTGTFGVAPQDAGVASASVTVGQMLGGSVGTALLNTIFAGAVAAYITAHLAAAALIGRQALTGLALAHGYDTAFWWIAGIFALGAVVGGVLLRPGPLGQQRTPSPAPDGVTTAQAQASRERAR
jgi:MFS family permease